MAQSLKERYETKRVQNLSERIKRLDEQVIVENARAKLIVEAMDQSDLDKVSAIMQKLSSIKTPELPKLSAAIEKAQAEVNKYTAGGPLSQAWSKLKGMAGIDNPIVKVTTFADALENGFSQIPQILKNNGVNLQKADLSKSLMSTLGTQFTGAGGGEGGMKSNPTDTSKSPGTASTDDSNVGSDKYEPAVKGTNIGSKSDEELSNTSFGGKPDSGTYDIPGQTGAQTGTKTGTTAQQPQPKKSGTKPTPPKVSPRDEENMAAEGLQLEADDGSNKLKSIADQLRKALAPRGIFGVFKKVPYINSDELAQELLKAPLKTFANVAKRINSGAKAAEIAPDLKDAVNAHGGAETKGTVQPEPEKQASQTNPSEPAKDTTTTTGTSQTGEKPAQPQGGGAPQNQAAALQKVKNLLTQARKDKKGLGDFVKKLMDAGLDPNKL